MQSETELIRQIKSGDIYAFRELVEQNKKNIYRLAFNLTGSREDAEDVSQDVFIKAYRSLNKFRGDSKISTWLYTITVNTCYSMKRKKSYTHMQTNENMEEIMDNSNIETNQTGRDNPERSTESGFIRENIEKALMKLSKRERSVFVLRNYKELPFDEIVDILKLRPGTVRNLNFRAIKKLRKELSFYNNGIYSEAIND